MELQLKDIPDFPGYRVGNDGSVWTAWEVVKTKPQSSRITENWRPMKLGQSHDGYPQIEIRKDGHPRRFKVHQLVLMAFVGPRPSGMQGCHNNGIKTDNRPENLRWDTVKANARDRINHGTQLRGGDSHQSKLTEEQVLEIRRNARLGVTRKAQAARFGVTTHTIGAIVWRVNWTHLPEEKVFVVALSDNIQPIEAATVEVLAWNQFVLEGEGEMLTVKASARRLGCSPMQMEHFLRKNFVRVYKPNGVKCIKPSDFNRIEFTNNKLSLREVGPRAAVLGMERF